MTPEREAEIRFLAGLKRTFYVGAEQELLKSVGELLEEIDTLRSKLSNAENALSWVGQPCT